MTLHAFGEWKALSYSGAPSNNSFNRRAEEYFVLSLCSVGVNAFRRASGWFER